MKVLHIVGRKNHGKTELVVQLVRELTKRNLRIGTFKNCGHEHELDAPGKDSYKHREAGATTVAVVTPSLLALYQPRDGRENIYEHFGAHFEGCDLVLIEGDLEGPGPKIEVWGRIPGTIPMAAQGNGIVGIVSDDPVNIDIDIPVWPRSDLPALADRVPDLAQEI